MRSTLGSGFRDMVFGATSTPRTLRVLSGMKLLFLKTDGVSPRKAMSISTPEIFPETVSHSLNLYI